MSLKRRLAREQRRLGRREAADRAAWAQAIAVIEKAEAVERTQGLALTSASDDAVERRETPMHRELEMVETGLGRMERWRARAIGIGITSAATSPPLTYPDAAQSSRAPTPGEGATARWASVEARRDADQSEALMQDTYARLQRLIADLDARQEYMDAQQREKAWQALLRKLEDAHAGLDDIQATRAARAVLRDELAEIEQPEASQVRETVRETGCEDCGADEDPKEGHYAG
jgi:hypothetical protein